MLDAEVRIGELMAKVPKASGGDHGNQYTGGKNYAAIDFAKTKAKVISDAGLKPRQTQQFETLAKNPEIVAEAKAAKQQLARTDLTSSPTVTRLETKSDALKRVNIPKQKAYEQRRQRECMRTFTRKTGDCFTQ